VNIQPSKTGVILIAAILAAVVSGLFFVLEATPLFVAAYVFAIIGIALFCFGTLYLFSNMRSYPWFASYPITIGVYLACQIVFSCVFVVREIAAGEAFSLEWFIFLHGVLLAFVVLRLILLRGGKAIIEKRDEEVRGKVTWLRVLQADLEAVREQVPAHAREIQALIDDLRYSDPMSPSSLAQYEDEISESALLLKQAADQHDSEKISVLCAALRRQLRDRNTRVKAMK